MALLNSYDYDGLSSYDYNGSYGLGWNPVKSVSRGVKSAAKAVYKAPAGALKVATSVAKVPFKATTAVTKAAQEVANFGVKSALNIAKDTHKVAGSTMALPFRAIVDSGKGLTSGFKKTISGKSTAGNGSPTGGTVEVQTASGVVSMSPETAQAAADVAATLPGGSASGGYSTAGSSGSGGGGGGGDTGVDDPQTQALTTPEKVPFFKDPKKLAMVGGGLILLYLGYKYTRRGGRRRKS